MLETMTQGESGTAARSSGLTGPQTNCTSPSGSHCARPAAGSASRQAAATDDTNNIRALMVLSSVWLRGRPA